MVCIDSYFTSNKVLLLCLGLSPFQQSKLENIFQKVGFIFLLSILLTASLFQLTTFFTSTITVDLLIRVISSSLFFFFLVINYISFDGNVVKDFLMQLEHIYNELRDENENSIIERYGYEAKYFTVALTTLGICGIIIINIAQFWMEILDVVLSRNISRLRSTTYFMTEYFVDQEKYTYLILLHMNTAIWIGSLASIATGSMFIAFAIHICGLFRIASYRIERSMKLNSLQAIKKENLITEELICAIDMHREAMRLAVHLASKLEIMLLSLIIFGVISQSLSLYRIFKGITSRDKDMDFFVPILAIILVIAYMFLTNYCGQYFTDHNNHVFRTTYNIQWYIAPKSAQKIILFLLLKGNKDFTIVIGGVIVGSLQCFITLANASLSYFTLLYSVQ